MRWNAELYQQQHIFSVKYGKDMLSIVNRAPNQTILDLGCGTGALTRELAAEGAHVIGLDASADMIAKAQADYPGLEFVVADATAMTYDSVFDTVYSNAALHWIKDQPTLLARLYQALKPGGHLVAEFGAKGNIETIQRAFCSILQELNRHFVSQFFFPAPQEYKILLETAGFTVDYIEDFARPTPLAGGVDGLRKWLLQFYDDYLKTITPWKKNRFLRKWKSPAPPYGTPTNGWLITGVYGSLPTNPKGVFSQQQPVVYLQIRICAANGRFWLIRVLHINSWQGVRGSSESNGHLAYDAVSTRSNNAAKKQIGKRAKGQF